MGNWGPYVLCAVAVAGLLWAVRALWTNVAPIVPLAPTLFDAVIGTFRILVSSFAKMRAETSVDPPAAQGMTISTAREGYRSCPCPGMDNPSASIVYPTIHTILLEAPMVDLLPETIGFFSPSLPPREGKAVGDEGIMSLGLEIVNATRENLALGEQLFLLQGPTSGRDGKNDAILDNFELGNLSNEQESDDISTVYGSSVLARNMHFDLIKEEGLS